MRTLWIAAVFALMLQSLAGNYNAQVFSQRPLAAVPAAAGFPFSDGFETGVLNPANWVANTVPGGVGTVLVNTDAPHSGSYSVFIGQKVVGFTTTTLILSIDLTEKKDVFLDFWWRGVGFAGSGSNGVYIRANSGSTWASIQPLDDNSLSYAHKLINITRKALIAGISPNSQFQIGITFATGNSFDTDSGIIIDDLRLTTRQQEIATFPFQQDSFEASSFNRGWFSQSTGAGSVQLDTDYPHTGTKSVFVGQKRTGFTSSSLILAIDLSKQNDVFLDFWWRAIGFAGNNPGNAVFISDNDGTTWTNIRDMNNNNPSYVHELVNITDLATAHGVTLNNSFQLRISFGTGNSFDTNSGIIVDDVRLTTRANELATFPFALDNFETGIFRQGLYPKSASTGSTEIEADSPHSGSHDVFIGQETPGFASSALILAVNLSGQSSVFLDFWWRTKGAPNDIGHDDVYISNDDGITWTQIHALLNDSANYKHEVINIASAASAKGITLNNKFQIRILFNASNSGASNSGIIVDDLRLGTKDPSKTFVFISIVRK